MLPTTQSQQRNNCGSQTSGASILTHLVKLLEADITRHPLLRAAITADLYRGVRLEASSAVQAVAVPGCWHHVLVSSCAAVLVNDGGDRWMLSVASVFPALRQLQSVYVSYCEVLTGLAIDAQLRQGQPPASVP
jgi:hypothetical protein